jgi:hypothetical protein
MGMMRMMKKKYQQSRFWSDDIQISVVPGSCLLLAACFVLLIKQTWKTEESADKIQTQ